MMNPSAISSAALTESANFFVSAMQLLVAGGTLEGDTYLVGEKSVPRAELPRALSQLYADIADSTADARLAEDLFALVSDSDLTPSRRLYAVMERLHSGPSDSPGASAAPADRVAPADDANRQLLLEAYRAVRALTVGQCLDAEVGVDLPARLLAAAGAEA